MPNEIDELMRLDPLELSAQNIDDIILYHRKARLMFDAGIKPKRGTSTPIDLGKIGLVKKPEIKKRSFK